VTQHERELGFNLLSALENIEQLTGKDNEKRFYLSHLNQLSRLQRSVLAQVLKDTHVAGPIHSGERSPFKLLASRKLWRQFTDDLAFWVNSVTECQRNESLPEPELDQQSLTADCVDDSTIAYWSRLFGQGKVSVSAKAQMALTLATVYPSGLTPDVLANRVSLSRRSTGEYLKEGFQDQGIFGVCFPRTNLQTVGYRLGKNAVQFLEGWRTISRWSSGTTMEPAQAPEAVIA